jgi:hypothetical protein
MSRPLALSQSALLSAAGVATLAFNPAFGERWSVSRLSTSCTVSNPMPEVRVYRGSAVATNFLFGTYTGSMDAATAAPSEEFEQQDVLTVTCAPPSGIAAGALAGARWTVTIGGLIVPRG